MSLRARLLIALALTALVVDGVAGYWNLNRLVASERGIAASYTRMLSLENLLSAMKDAETGQRGYLISRDESYLAPYRQAMSSLDSQLAQLRETWPQPSQADIAAMRTAFEAKHAKMQRTIALAGSGEPSSAASIVREGSGKRQMDEVRAIAGRLREQEVARLAEAEARAGAARATALVTLGVAALVAAVAVAVCLVLLRRELITGLAVANERAVLLQEADAARASAEAANAMKDEFLAKLSHELRNPLHAMLGWLEILRQRPDDSSLSARAMQTMTRNARVLQRMIEDLLDLSRAARGKLELQRAPVALDDVLRTVVDSLRPSAEGKGVTLEQHIETLPAPVVGDVDRLSQVAVNLVANAIKFTPEGGRVTVSLSSGRDTARLVVTDTGLGIPPESLAHVFEPFRQAGPPIAGPEGGLGLGLAIAQQIVELHGGTIEASSAGIGAGARFEVRVPMSAPEPVALNP